jgi:hypothetical protein
MSGRLKYTQQNHYWQKEKRRLKVFENKVLRKIFGS